MSSNSKAIPQHKRLAAGEKVGFKKGGLVGASSGLLKSGKPTSPLTDAKRANGVPGYKKGGGMC